MATGLSQMFNPRRELGQTKFIATALGIGDLADRSLPLEQCVATIHRAMDYGLNVIDTAPSYEDGYSEQVVGAALKGRREGMFVIDKIDHFDRPVAPQVESSLAKLGLESIDLFVFHGMSKMQDLDQAMAPGGLFDQLHKCIEQGKCRFAGISSHHPEVLRQVIVNAAAKVILFPVGPFVDLRYVQEILPLARANRVGTVCFKTFGAGKLLGDTSGYGRPLQERPRGKFSSGGEDVKQSQLPRLTVEQCVQFTLSCDPDVALLGMSFPNEVDAATRAAVNLVRPLSLQKMFEIRRLAEQAIEGKGECWWNPKEG